MQSACQKKSEILSGEESIVQNHYIFFIQYPSLNKKRISRLIREEEHITENQGEKRQHTQTQGDSAIWVIKHSH